MPELVGSEWFAEQHESVTNAKAFAEILRGKWLVEISELDAFSKADTTRVKQAITCQRDRYRVPWEKHASDHPRQCVFAGTTNKDDWNRDETGGRRFWPIECKGAIDIDGIRNARIQLFAEAVQRFKAGESWWEMPEQETVDQQSTRFDGDVWIDAVAAYVEGKSTVTTLEILTDALTIEIARLTDVDKRRVGRCLRALGWKKKSKRLNRKAFTKIWYPPAE